MHACSIAIRLLNHHVQHKVCSNLFHPAFLHSFLHRSFIRLHQAFLHPFHPAVLHFFLFSSGQPYSSGFKEDFCTTRSFFILRSLIDKDKQFGQKRKAGKLYCCIVDFSKAFDTVPRAVLWQVLEELGVHGRILDSIKSLYAHNSTAVRSSQGIFAIFRCLWGLSKGVRCVQLCLI